MLEDDFQASDSQCGPFVHPSADSCTDEERHQIGEKKCVECGVFCEAPAAFPLSVRVDATLVYA